MNESRKRAPIKSKTSPLIDTVSETPSLKLVARERCQFIVFLILSLVTALLTAILAFIDPAPFHRFLGDINPVGVLLTTVFIGFFCFTYLLNSTTLAIYKKQNLRDYFTVAGIALAFGIEVVLADIWLVDYSADINILFPKSLLFYPAIGYIVEIVFHILPITLIVMILSLFRNLSENNRVWFGMVVVIILEPIYQVWLLSQDTLTTALYTGIHVFLFSLTQLIIFKRYDFISMFLFRLVFYMVWHIVWGHFRLELVF